MFWAITKRRMRLVRRRVEDLKNRFEEYRIVNQQQRLVNENGKRTIVERMQEWFQVYVPVATLEIDFGVQSLDSWGGQMNDLKWSVRNKIEIKKRKLLESRSWYFLGSLYFAYLCWHYVSSVALMHVDQ